MHKLFGRTLKQIPSIINTSKYITQIEQYLEYFDLDQFLFITFNELTKNRGAVLKKTFEFLSVDPNSLLSEDVSIRNPSGTATKLKKAGMFVSRIRHSPGFSGMIDLIPDKTRSEIRRKFVESPLSYAVVKSDIDAFQKQMVPLTEETRDYLLGVFSEATGKLECFIDEKLPGWHR